jgi:hypothetical protein
MSVIEDLRKNIDTTPLFAAVGVTDLAVEKVREARVRATKVSTDLRADLEPAKVVAQVKELPAVALNQSLVMGGKVTEGYEDLAARGKKLVSRIRNQQATKDLVAQAEVAVAQAKGAVTSARNAAAEIEKSAKATVTTGRKEAARVANTLVDSVSDEAKVVQAEVAGSVKRTRTAAKRTATTTRNQAKKAATTTKAATTSARKTAASAPKATKKAAAKVGD